MGNKESNNSFNEIKHNEIDRYLTEITNKHIKDVFIDFIKKDLKEFENYIDIYVIKEEDPIKVQIKNKLKYPEFTFFHYYFEYSNIYEINKTIYRAVEHWIKENNLVKSKEFEKDKLKLLIKSQKIRIKPLIYDEIMNLLM